MGSPYLFPGEAITTEILTIIHWAQRRNQVCLKYFHRNKVCDCTDGTICIGDIKQSYICVGCYKRGLPFFYLRQPYFSHRQFCHKLRRKSKSKFRKKKKISTRNPKIITFFSLGQLPAILWSQTVLPYIEEDNNKLPIQILPNSGNTITNQGKIFLYFYGQVFHF